MYKSSNWDRKSQPSEIMTEPLNPRETPSETPLNLKNFSRLVFYITLITSK